ncbi:MAG: M48 family metallopeptidase [Bacteroidales bacterium]|nr:M48 family metallopeptidase [Bacteroidales bacterium]
MVTKTAIKGLDVSTILHPEDKSTMDTLKKIPGFKTVVDKTVGSIMEKYAAVEYSGEGINVSSQCLPTLNSQIREACRILDIKEIPNCSINWFYHIGSFSVGEKNRRIVFPSGSVDLLTAEELNFLIGHELGHMKCGHKTYHMLTEAMYRPMIASDWGIIMNLVKMPLLNWYRVSDFTADRMGLLCCQDIEVAIKTMIKMAGLPKKYHNQIHINSFIQQAIDFSKNHSGIFDEMIKYLSINAACMPWLVLRASELLLWYQTGEYDRIINNNRCLR